MPKFKIDEPPIAWIGWNGDDGYQSIYVGHNGVTKITHREMWCGENVIHWLEIWKESRIVARFNLANVDSVHYEDFPCLQTK